MTDARQPDSIPSPLRPLKLAAAIDRPLIRGKGDSVRFLVVDVTAPVLELAESARRPKAPLNLALVIDASGSMAGLPIEAAKEAALRLAENLGETDRLSVVSFDSEVTVHVDGRRQDAAGRSAAAAAIRGLDAGSSTNLSGGWLKGCECVATGMEREPGLRNHVVLLSDGQANVGLLEPDELASHAAQLRARGLFSSTVGIGEGYSNVQLEAIAASGGGRLHHAAGSAEIVELVLGELDELRATTVESCDIVIALPESFRVEVVGDYAFAPEGARERAREGASDIRWAAVLGAIGSGASRTAVFKLTCPPGREGDHVELKVAARWKGIEAKEVVETLPLACPLVFAPGKECKAQPFDPELKTRVARAWQLAIVRAATHWNQEGDLGRARDFVATELRHLERYVRGLSAAVEILQPLQNFGASVGQRVYGRMAAKEMMNASRKLNRGERELREIPAKSWVEHMPK